MLYLIDQLEDATLSLLNMYYNVFRACAHTLSPHPMHSIINAHTHIWSIFDIEKYPKIIWETTQKEKKTKR